MSRIIEWAFRRRDYTRSPTGPQRCECRACCHSALRDRRQEFLCDALRRVSQDGADS